MHAFFQHKLYCCTAMRKWLKKGFEYKAATVCLDTDWMRKETVQFFFLEQKGSSEQIQWFISALLHSCYRINNCKAVIVRTVNSLLNMKSTIMHHIQFISHSMLVDMCFSVVPRVLLTMDDTQKEKSDQHLKSSLI